MDNREASAINEVVLMQVVAALHSIAGAIKFAGILIFLALMVIGRVWTL